MFMFAVCFFFFKQKTAYEMRISDWSSDVCSSDLWWSVQKVELQLSGDLGALPQRTRNVVDKVKLACLLRVADAIHLDSRRAPRFIRTITNPKIGRAHV